MPTEVAKVFFCPGSGGLSMLCRWFLSSAQLSQWSPTAMLNGPSDCCMPHEVTTTIVTDVQLLAVSGLQNKAVRPLTMRVVKCYKPADDAHKVHQAMNPLQQETIVSSAGLKNLYASV